MKIFSISLFIFALFSCGIDVTMDTENNDSYVSMHDSEQSDEEDDKADAEDEDTSQVDQISLIDFSQRGPHEIDIGTYTASVSNCQNINYTIYSPREISNSTIVVLGHGFARGPDVMSGWAEHISSWGFDVILPTLCHYNILFGVDHEMNGLNMKELADLQSASKVIYAGHSAGGLAAIIAASHDNKTAGIVGLDATDTEGVPGVDDYIGRDYAGSVYGFAYAIFGEASSCNANNNGIELFKMMNDYRLLRVSSADHCDFENPTNSLCTMNCENSIELFDNAVIESAIITLGTAAVISLSDSSSDASLWWTNEGLDDWIYSGLIQEIE